MAYINSCLDQLGILYRIHLTAETDSPIAWQISLNLVLGHLHYARPGRGLSSLVGLSFLLFKV